MDINVTASKADLNFDGVSLKAGELTIETVPFGRSSRRVAHLPLEAVTATDPAKRSTPAVIHCSPGELRRFCEETLEQLDAQTEPLGSPSP